MDQKRIDDSELTFRIAGAAGPYRLYDWSPDNSKEIERGWIIRADTSQELARRISVNPDELSKTVKKYNSYCEQGEDPEFGRDPESLLPLRNPPYYAMPLWPGGPSTHGGPRRNAKAQILNLDGNPIPRLYGAGEFGSIHGMLYYAGGLVGECIAFGRIAGENAIRELRQ
jgi:succinate dehydrogenase/fumarate reductase flavoprotein subunit